MVALLGAGLLGAGLLGGPLTVSAQAERKAEPPPASVGDKTHDLPNGMPSSEPATSDAGHSSARTREGPASKTAKEVCVRETEALAEAKTKYLAQHPQVAELSSRVKAACRSARTVDCAEARVEIAIARGKYLERHPAIVLAEAKEKALCAPAPSRACARARAELIALNTKYLEKHPRIIAAVDEVSKSCGGRKKTRRP